MYCEILPEACPPLDSLDTEISNIFRRIDKAAATRGDFLSYAALGRKNPGTVDPCQWSSCSFFKDKVKIHNISKKLPKPRDHSNFLAELSIPAGSGRYKEGRKGHIDFWMYAEFDPLNAVINIEPLDDGEDQP